MIWLVIALWLLGIPVMAINSGSEFKDVPRWFYWALVAIWPGTVVAGMLLVALGWFMERKHD